MRGALSAFGEEAYYGLRLVELVPLPESSTGLLLARLAGPGTIQLYDQPRSPWRLGYALSTEEREPLLAAGALTDDEGVIVWPPGTLRGFMLYYVLAHEVAHHMLQHERRLRGERGARTREHEERADVIAARLRAGLA